MLNSERKLGDSGNERGIFFVRVDAREGQGLFLANRSMGFDSSLKALEASGLKMPKLLDVVRRVEEAESIRKKITGRFWIEDSPEIGEGSKEYVFNRERLVERGGSIEVNRTVFIHEGSGPFMLEVHGDQYTNYYRRRFDLYGNGGSDMITNMILGIKESDIIPMKILSINAFSEIRRKA